MFTPQEVKILTSRAVGQEVEVCNFSLQLYTDGKLGYLASHQRLCVEARIKNRRKTLCFFVKSVPYDVPSQADYVLDKGVFETETRFYNEIVPKLYHGYKGKQFIPSCYLVKKDVLVFEDLGLRGYTIRNNIFSKEFVASGLASIAQLHASSLLMEANEGVSMKKMYPDAFEERAFCQTGKTRRWFDVGVNAAVAIAKYLDLDSSLIRTACEEIFPAMEPSTTKSNVISHGDLWGNNLMYNNDVPPNCLLVDFQLMRYSPLGHDVAQFLYLCTDGNFRETWEETMLKHYYAVLCEILNSSELTVKIPPWSEVVDGFEEQRLSALITAVLYFQTVLLDKTFSASIMDDPVSYNNFLLHNRDDIVITNMKRDQQYGERIAEAVTMLVEFSSRLGELPKPS